MAAPAKMGIDYYSHDVTMLTDMRFRRVRRDYGAISLIIYQALLDFIYSGEGYYLKYDSTTKDDIIWNITDYVKGKNEPDEKEIEEIINALILSGMFCQKSYADFQILTSEHIQLQYYQATLKRKFTRIKPQLWLLDMDTMKEISVKSPIYIQLSSDNDGNNSVNDVINEQSKVKEMKVNISKENKIIVEENKENTQSSALSVENVPLAQNYTKTILPENQAITPSPPPPEEENSFLSAAPQYINNNASVVKLTISEYNELCRDYRMKDINSYIRKMDLYLTSNGKTYSDYKTALLKWMIDDNVEKKGAHSYDPDEIEQYALMHTPKLKKKTPPADSDK